MSIEARSDSPGSKLCEPAGAAVDGKTHPLDSQSDAWLLLREFTHRINNELTSAICMVAIAASRSRNRQVREALIAVQERLQAYARVQHTLQMPEHVTLVDAAAYLKLLCHAISRSKLEFREIDLLFVERPVQMSCDRCWRLGLIVSELITNSTRHAFGGGGGSIRVDLVPLRSVVECRVADNGAGKNSAGSGRGRLIVEGLVRSLGGTITQRFGRRGSSSVVRIPLKPGAMGQRSYSRAKSSRATDGANARGMRGRLGRREI
jgi:two-component sensor histidine kinase